jgi:hypothetical protein
LGFGFDSLGCAFWCFIDRCGGGCCCCLFYRSGLFGNGRLLTFVLDLDSWFFGGALCGLLLCSLGLWSCCFIAWCSNFGLGHWFRFRFRFLLFSRGLRYCLWVLLLIFKVNE